MARQDIGMTVAAVQLVLNPVHNIRPAAHRGTREQAAWLRDANEAADQEYAKACGNAPHE